MLALGISFLVACGLILLFKRIGQSSIVACLAAGLLLQFGGDLVGGAHASARADMQSLGILFLLFMAGLETDLGLLRRDWKLVGITGLGQIAVNLAAAAALGLVLAQLGWLELADRNAVLVFGLCLTLSSTVVVLGLLRTHRATGTRYGQAIVGLMVLQDLVAVVALSLLGLEEGGHSLGPRPLMRLAIEGVLLSVVMLALSRTLLPWVLVRIERDEGLLLIGAIGWCTAVAGTSHFTGFPPTIAAFLAGVALSETPQKHAIMPRIEPLKTFGLTIYFIYLGYSTDIASFDPSMFGPILFGVALIVAGRPALMRVLGHWGGLDSHGSQRFGLTINQGSEFAMILAAAALAAGLFTPDTFLVVVLISVGSLVIGAWTHERGAHRDPSPAHSA